VTATVTKNQPAIEGDYIPCKFTPTQIQTLVTPQASPVLTDADAESLKQQVITAALTQGGDPLVSQVVLNALVAALSNDTLTGIRPSEALNKVIAALASAR
jgi:hypothetical protein